MASEGKARRASESSAASGGSISSGSAASRSASAGNATMNGANYRKSSFPKPPKEFDAKAKAAEPGTKHKRSDDQHQPSTSATSTASTTESSPVYLPPGIGFEFRKEAEHRDDFVADPAGGIKPAAAAAAAATTTKAQDLPYGDAGIGTPYTSTAALTMNADGSPRRKSYNDVVGEDSGLAAARRALWEDLPATATSTSEAKVTEASALGSSSSSSSSSGSSEDEHEDGDDDFELPPVPCPHEPAHTTLKPSRPCLRRRSTTATTNRSLSSSTSSLPPQASTSRTGESTPTHESSSSRSTTTTTTVQFSDEPHELAMTYSAHDYERKSPSGPVEKLSIRDWIELRDVREAIGVWSGRIQPWDSSGSSSATNGPACDAGNDSQHSSRLNSPVKDAVSPIGVHAVSAAWPVASSSSSSGGGGSSSGYQHHHHQIHRSGSRTPSPSSSMHTSMFPNGNGILNHQSYAQPQPPLSSQHPLSLSSTSTSSSPPPSPTTPSSVQQTHQHQPQQVVHHHHTHHTNSMPPSPPSASSPILGTKTSSNSLRQMINGSSAITSPIESGTAAAAAADDTVSSTRTTPTAPRLVRGYSHISGAASVLTVGGAAGKTRST